MKRCSSLFALKMAARKQETNKFCQFFFLVIEDSTEERIKSKVNTNFGSVKYFENVNKMDNSMENTFTGRSRQYKFQILDCLE